MDSQVNAHISDTANESPNLAVPDDARAFEAEAPDFTVVFERKGKQYILRVPWAQFDLLPKVPNDFLLSKGIDSSLQVIEL